MSIRHAQPVRFSPAGLSDSLDETDIFDGACANLSNLIPDPTTKNLWTCRPASVLQTSFGSFTTPGFISVFKVLGSLVYGLIASGRNAGKDEPFCYNIITGAFVTVSGVTASNVPTSPTTTGDWVPPTMDLIGVDLMVTHPGFDGVTNFVGWFDTTNPAAPVWHAGNLTLAGQITGLGTITGGTLYTNGTYAAVPLTGGSGTGATANITVAGGLVVLVTEVAPGKNYVVGDTLSATAGTIGGTGSGFSVPVASVNTGLIQFTTPPAWVRQFFQRAYYGINPPTGQPSAIFTDVLAPLTATNANQALTFGDNLPLTAAWGLPLNNQLGGIIQSLMVFKGVAQIEQITGDAALMNLDINSLDVATGTNSPRSLCNTPKGVAFLAPDGLRIIDFNAHVGEPIGIAGSGVNVPFRFPISPTRACAACDSETIRISVQNSNAGGTPTQEFWYDLTRQIWSGPHTFPASEIDVYSGQFVIAPVGVTAKLFLGQTLPSSTSGSIENGVQMAWTFQTVVLKDNEQMAMSAISELQIKTSVVANMAGINVSAQDQDGNIYATLFYPFSAAASLWGSAIWGVNLWGGQQLALSPRRINFSTPVVYNRLAFNVSGACAQGFQIGDIFFRRQILGYMQASG